MCVVEAVSVDTTVDVQVDVLCWPSFELLTGAANSNILHVFMNLIVIININMQHHHQQPQQYLSIM